MECIYLIRRFLPREPIQKLVVLEIFKTTIFFSYFILEPDFNGSLIYSN